MDFATLNAVDPHDDGSWLHLSHPATGESLYLDGGKIVTTETGAPCRVKVRGNRSPRVKAITAARKRAEERHALRVMKASPREEAALLRQNAEDVEQFQRDLLLATVADMENIVITEGEKPAACTPDNVLAALSHPLFMVQIFNRSADEAALFTSAPTG